MKITKIIFDNIGPIAHEEIEPDLITVFEGRNGAGKSLRLKGIRAALSVPKRGENFVGLLGDAAHRGYVALTLNTGVAITRDVNQVASPLRVEGKGRGKTTEAEANRFVTNTFDAESVNCESFLLEDKKERTRLILEAIPFEIDREELGRIAPDVKLINAHPLEVVDTVRKFYYDQRTDLNRSAKEKRAASEELSRTIQSEVDIQQIDADIAEIESRLAALQQEHDEKIDHAVIESNNILTEVREKAAAILDEKREEIASKIDALKAELSVCQEQHLGTIMRAEQKEAQIVAGVRSEADAMLSDGSTALRLAVQGLRQQRDIEVTAQAQREIATRNLQAAAKIEGEAGLLSSKLDEIEAFKNSMLSKLPLPGITLEGGEIKIDGKPYDQVPDSRRVILAIDLALQRTDGIILCDGVEALDDTNFEKVLNYVRTKGRQMFFGRATVGTNEHPITELHIRKLGALE